LRVRLKWVGVELADHVGVAKAGREFNLPGSSFYRWKQKYQKAGPSGMYEKDPSPIASRAEHLLRGLRKSWNFAGSIRSELCGLSIT
jgi:hypothetical protein